MADKCFRNLRQTLFRSVVFIFLAHTIKDTVSTPFLGVSAFQPLFDEKETQVTTDQFVPLDLTCKARAEPLPIYEWSKDKSMHDDQSTSVGVRGNATTHDGRTVLTIQNVTWADRGVYFCNAWNSKGYNFKKYNVHVNRTYIKLLFCSLICISFFGTTLPLRLCCKYFHCLHCKSLVSLCEES